MPVTNNKILSGYRMKFFSENISYRPWAVFGIVLAASSLISYANLGLPFVSWLLLFGIFLPVSLSIFLIFHKNTNAEGGKPFWLKEFLPPIAPWIWALTFFLLTLLYFYKLGQIPFWPLMDDGQCAFFADKLNEKWDWRLLFGNGQLEPLFIWCLAFFFKIAGVSLGNIRLFPVLTSLTTLGLGYWAARQYFSQS